MLDFRSEIWKLEEVSKSIAEKGKEETDIEFMTTVQQIQNSIHAAYIALRRIDQKGGK